ncbi:hypothetical protein C0J52_28446 [Blattella germanica]|nr:hypothetical protein C0J52_28446 [Blattella germanica]
MQKLQTIVPRDGSYEASEPNVWRWRSIKEKLENPNSNLKSFSVPKKSCFHELEQCVVNYVGEKYNEGFPVTREVMVFQNNSALFQNVA